MNRTNRDDVYISPVAIVKLFDDTRKEVGNEVFKSRKYKTLREGWIAGMFSVALSLYEGGVWWLRPNPKDEAPDYFAFNTKWDKENGFWIADNTNFEVFEFGPMSQDSLIEAILKKVENWKAETISVVCYVSKTYYPINFQHIYDDLATSVIKVKDIWILSSLQTNDNYFAIQVYPRLLLLPKIPNVVPRYFMEPYQFVSKGRGKVHKEIGKLALSSNMKFEVFK